MLKGIRPPVETVGVGTPVEIVYPQSHATGNGIGEELAGVVALQSACTSFYLDTTDSMSRSRFGDAGDIGTSMGEDHHQGLARSHVLSDGSIYWFLSHSRVEPGAHGTLTQYRYAGPRDADHIVQTSPLTVAPMATEPLLLDERHPSDIAFLPDVNGADAGYLFVTEETDQNAVAVYRWTPGQQLTWQGHIGTGPDNPFPTRGPNFLFIDLLDTRYCLGIASNNWANGAGWCYLYWADPDKLFPSSTPGTMDVSAFQSDPYISPHPFPVVGSPCQTKLVRDPWGWWLLAFRADPPDSEQGTDYVDLYRVTLDPFTIWERQSRVQIGFRAGDTGFASTGTHHVEASGRLLISSSYRWAEDEGPGSSSYVSRVDECPSSTPPAGQTTPGSAPIGEGNPPHRPD
jgi:hypothetical protein